VQLTILGKSPSWPDAGGACSGYLVEEQGFRLLLDCGPGVFGKARELIDYATVDAVLITHMHSDHFLDLIPFSYALAYAPRQQPVPVGGYPGTDCPACPPLHAPPGAIEVFRHIVCCWGKEDLIETAFEISEYEPSADLEVGPFTVRFCEVPHFIPTFAVDLTSHDTRFTFSADCSPNEELVGFARDTQLLLIEATLPRPERTGIRGHLTPGEAGDHGRRAGAQRLILTHYSDELDPAWVQSEAEQTYGDSVELAREGAVYELSSAAPQPLTGSVEPPLAEQHAVGAGGAAA
jgi:ribonuclease BN (tRNA processing enzyme)